MSLAATESPDSSIVNVAVRSLVFGLIAFGAMSVYAGSVDSAGELITSAFFALFGFIFLITQYFQLVRHHPRRLEWPGDDGGRVRVGLDGIGSAVNDTTRELGGTLGVAILGSVFSSIFAARFLPARAVENPDLLPA